MSESPAYRLTYFDIRGRAEVSRYLFALSKTPYEDVRISPKSWPRLKPTVPFGQLPVLHIGDAGYCQSGAIMRFLARRFGFYGSTLEDGLRIDQIWCAMCDIIDEHTTLNSMSNREEQEARRRKLMEEDVPKFQQFLESQLHDDEWLVGGKVSLADAVVFELFTGLLHTDGTLGDWRHRGDRRVARLVDRFACLPEIADYIGRRPLTAF